MTDLERKNSNLPPRYLLSSRTLVDVCPWIIRLIMDQILKQPAGIAGRKALEVTINIGSIVPQVWAKDNKIPPSHLGKLCDQIASSPECRT